MQVVQIVLGTISVLFSVWLLFMLCYQLYISFFGFGKQEKDYADHAPSSRFLILVPAHNEEKVIGDIIDNLKNMEYPPELYDFYVIADNCEDQTAQVARGLGAKVIETHKETPDSPTGKPIALKKALDYIGDYHKQYDLLMIFDADNLIDPNMLLEVNSQYLDKDKPELIQCYLGSKNKQGLVAWFYYTSYTITNRFFQLAKTRAGLNCSIGGTGFAISTEYLYERGGWTTMSLTEDFEIQVEATLEGRRILWNHNVRVYDEKPTRIFASLRQRTRWAQGHWFVCFRNTKRVFTALREKKISSAEAISIFTYMYSLSPYVIVLLQLIGSIVYALTGWDKTVLDLNNIMNIPGMLIFIYSFLLLFYIADWMDNKVRLDLLALPKMLVSFLLNMVVATISQVGGLFRYRRQNQWVKTDHSICEQPAHRNLRLSRKQMLLDKSSATEEEHA